MLFTVLPSADPALGRLDYHSLSDRALMEMLIGGMFEQSKRVFEDSSGNFLDIVDWPGVNLHENDEHVASIEFKDYCFTGPFEFKFIPALVVSFKAVYAGLKGTLETSLLPRHLEIFDVSENALAGSLRFKEFPRSLKEIYLSENFFDGSCALDALPEPLIILRAFRNKFSGELKLNSLPRGMKELRIDQNYFTGSISIEKLPTSMQAIHLGENSFSGDFRMLSFPAALRKVDVSLNAISEKIILSKSAGEMTFSLYCDAVTSVVDADGSEHAWNARILANHHPW